MLYETLYLLVVCGKCSSGWEMACYWFSTTDSLLRTQRSSGIGIVYRKLFRNAKQKKMEETLSSDFPSLHKLRWVFVGLGSFVSNFKLKCRLRYSYFIFCFPISFVLLWICIALSSILILKRSRNTWLFSSAELRGKRELWSRARPKWKTLRSSKRFSFFLVFINNVMLFHCIYSI